MLNFIKAARSQEEAVQVHLSPVGQGGQVHHQPDPRRQQQPRGGQNWFRRLIVVEGN